MALKCTIAVHNRFYVLNDSLFYRGRLSHSLVLVYMWDAIKLLKIINNNKNTEYQEDS